MSGILIAALLLANSFLPSQCTDNVKLRVVRQEEFNGCGTDDVGANMHVIYRLTNDSDHPIYVFGFAYDRDFMPHGYVLRFDQKNRKWLYPTGDNRPTGWSDLSVDFKSPKKLDVGQSLEFEACHSSWAERGQQFARTVYISCDAKSVAAVARFASSLVRRCLNEFAPPGQLKRWVASPFDSPRQPRGTELPDLFAPTWKEKL